MTTTTSSGVPRWEPPAPEALQAMLQGYEVIEVIGRGGMGAVYKARQLSLDRMVAIKILPPALWDDEEDYALRFRNEARVMARLMHPGMVAVFDFGETPDGQLYFVMEYVEGTDVAQMIASQKRLPPMNALAITAHVCDTLRYAHEHGVIHRDIKPANVMVDKEGRVKVADFGLARLTHQEEALTAGRTALGTPDFVAPEVLIIGAAVDHRADLYSLGVMLYEMLTGQLPRDVFPLPADCVPGLDRRFDQIVVRAMQPEPADRYTSALDFRRDLDHIVAVPVQQSRPAQPSVVRTASHESTKTKGTPWGLIAAGSAVLVATAAFLVMRQHQPPSRVVMMPAPGETLTPAPQVAPPPPASKPVEDHSVPPPAPGTPPKEMAGTAAPAPPPTSSLPPPAPPPETEADKKLNELEAQFRSAVIRDVTALHDKAVLDLDTHYAAAVGRELQAATAAGKLEDAVALRKDKDRLAAHEDIPATDASEAPKSLRDLHETYRTSLAKIEAGQNTGMKALNARYAQVLTVYQEELTRAGKTDETAKVSRRVNALLDAVLEHPAPAALPPDDPRASLAAFLPGTIWQWNAHMNERMEFLPDGTIDQKWWIQNGLKTGWEVVDANNVRLKILSGRKDNLTANLVFDKDRLSFGGTNFKAKDKLSKSPRVKPAAMDKSQKYVEGAIEAETLEVLEDTGGRPYNWDFRHLKLFSGGCVVLWLYSKPGNHLTLALPVSEKGRYQVRGVLGKTHGSAIVDIALDDATVAAGFDCYNESDTATNELDWGVHNLDAGEHRLRFTLTGNNPKAKSSYGLEVDYIRLEKK